MLTALCLVAVFLVFAPNTPLPPEWNPRQPLRVSEPMSPLTSWKLAAALADPAQCLTALGPAAEFSAEPDFEHSEQCHIRTQVKLTQIGAARLAEVATRCQIGLRLAMWMEHGIQPAARQRLGSTVTRLHHLSSYNCRAMRTGRGETTRMSTHATAEAIDITGVTLETGRKITLLQDWNSADPETREFLRDLRDSACTWFRMTLSPNYNSLHADHFHLQHTGWGTCR